MRSPQALEIILRRSIKTLNDVSLDLSFLDDKAINIISHIIATIPEDFNFKKTAEISDLTIPDYLSSDITEKDKEYASKNETGVKLKYRDSRKERIKFNIDEYLESIFFQLRQIHLCTFETIIINKGKEFYGPYFLNLELIFFIKLIRWKHLNSLHKFLPSPKFNIEEAILGLRRVSRRGLCALLQ